MFKNLKQNIGTKVESILKNDNLKRVQKILIIAFILLIIVDVLLVLDQEDEFPTFSLVFHKHATYQYYVITWIWGLITSQIFFPNKREMNSISSLNKVVFTLLLTSFFLIFGTIFKSAFSEIFGQLFLFISGAIVGYYFLPNDLDKINSE